MSSALAMAAGSFDPDIFDDTQEAAQQADKALAVRFYKGIVKDDAASIEAGRLICKDVDFVNIRVRGTKDNVVDRPVHDGDKQRFAALWAAYQSKERSPVVGTPLAEWPVIPNSMRQELLYLGFDTVENIADANDGMLSKVPGLQQLKNRARAFIEQSKGNAPLEALSARLEKLENDAATKDSVIEDQARQIAALKAAAGKK